MEILSGAAVRSNFKLSQEKSQGPAELVSAFNIALENKKLTLVDEKYDAFARHIMVAGNSRSTQGILGYVEHVNRVQRAALEALIN